MAVGMNCAVLNCWVTITASVSAPLRDASKLSNARKTTKPRTIANPVASTPNTPAARSPSWKYPPVGRGATDEQQRRDRQAGHHHRDNGRPGVRHETAVATSDAVSVGPATSSFVPIARI